MFDQPDDGFSMVENSLDPPPEHLYCSYFTLLGFGMLNGGCTNDLLHHVIPPPGVP